jgi:membrane-associated phospholipid phosphatase
MTLVAAIFVLRRFALYPLSYPDAVLVLCEASLLITKLALAPLKLAFGRTWPLYVHPSFLADGVYGFNFFSDGLQYESFPSGHIASVCALVVVLWTTYPRFRPLYAAIVVGMACALVLGNYHFLSDVIAGGFLGGVVARFTSALWDLAKKAFLPNSRRSVDGTSQA